jgi:uncharacterized protein (TIGR00251 family)
MDTLEIKEDGRWVTLRVRVQPRASRDRIVGVHDGALKVALTAPPVEGAANAALVKLLAKSLGIAKGDVELVRGDTSRDKVLRLLTTADSVRALVRGG